MRAWLLALLSIVGCAPVPASLPTASGGSPTIAPGAQTTTIPTSLANAFDKVCNGDASAPMEVIGSRHFVKLKVRGPASTETLRFHIDTGGNTRGLLLGQAAAEKLGVKTAADIGRTIGLGDHDVSLPEGASWSLGNADYEAFDRATRKGLSAGQIGAGFLSRYLVCIDPKNGRFGIAPLGSIAISDPAHPPIPLLMQVMGDNHAKYPFLLTHIRDGQNVVGGYGMLLDTGATTSMIESGKIDYLLKKDTHTAFAIGAAGDADMIAPRDSERMLRVGNIVLTAPSAKFPDTPKIEAGPATFVERPNGTWEKMFGFVGPTNGAYGAVANDVLDSFRLMIDYQREVVWLDPTGRTTDRSASLSRVGVSLRFGEDGCPTLTAITTTNTRDTLSALRVGDAILSIDQIDACKAMHDEIETALAGAPGTIKALKVRRGSETLDVKATTAALLPINP